MTQVHPTAIIDPSAHLGDEVEVGPFAIIEGEVQIGNRCRIAARAVIKSGVQIAEGNRVGEGAVIGGDPQHITATGNGLVVIGPENVFRENCTVHRALEETTSIGARNYFMVNTHVAHDVVIGNDCIMANNVMLGGHVEVHDFAYVSGCVAVHQFCRIGREVMVGGMARITRDVPPYVTICGETSRVVGLNVVGLRRRGYDRSQIQHLKNAYRTIYRSELPWKEIVLKLLKEHNEGPAAAFGNFFQEGDRGFIPERRSRRPAMLKVFPLQDDDQSDARRAG